MNIKYAEIERIRDTGFGQVRTISQGSVLPGGDGKTIHFVSIEGVSPKPKAGWYYTDSTGLFSETDPGVPAPPAEPIPWFELWYDRMLPAERATCRLAMTGENVIGVSFSDELDRGRLWAWAELADTRYDETFWAVNMMEAAGIIAPGRAVEILG